MGDVEVKALYKTCDICMNRITVITEQSNNHNNQDILIIFCQLLVRTILTQMCQTFDIVNGSIEVTYKVNNCFPTKGGLMKDMDFPGYRILI